MYLDIPMSTHQKKPLEKGGMTPSLPNGCFDSMYSAYLKTASSTPLFTSTEVTIASMSIPAIDCFIRKGN